MADIQKFIKVLNLIMGFATIGLGGFVLLKMFRWFQVKSITFSMNDIPRWLMPFFFALFGILVLSTQFEMPAVKRNCQFINHKLGVFVFYMYLGSLMGYFAELARINNDDLTQVICICCALGYLVLAVSMALLNLCGEDKTNRKVDDLKEKIISE